MRTAPAVLLLTLVLLASCGSPDPDREPGPRTLEGEAPTIIETIEVTAEGFSTDTLALDTREAFVLVNADSVSRRVEGSLDDDLHYDTGSMEPGEETTIAFRDEGIFVFTIDGDDGSDLTVTVELHPDQVLGS